MERKAKGTLPSPRRNLVPLLLCMKAVARCQCENHTRGFHCVPGRMHEPSSCWQGAPRPPVKQWDHTRWIMTSHRAVVMVSISPVEQRSNSRRLVNDKASHEHQSWHIHLVVYSVIILIIIIITHTFLYHRKVITSEAVYSPAFAGTKLYCLVTDEIGVISLSEATTQQCRGRTQIRDLWIASPMPYQQCHHTAVCNMFYV